MQLARNQNFIEEKKKEKKTLLSKVHISSYLPGISIISIFKCLPREDMKAKSSLFATYHLPFYHGQVKCYENNFYNFKELLLSFSISI